MIRPSELACSQAEMFLENMSKHRLRAERFTSRVRMRMSVWMRVRMHLCECLSNTCILLVDRYLTKIGMLPHSLLHHRWTARDLIALADLVSYGVLEVARKHVGGIILDRGETIIPQTRHQRIDARIVQLKIGKVEWLLIHLVFAGEVLHGCH